MDQNSTDKDIFGKAISAYFHHKDETDIIVHSPDFDDDIIPVAYLFRSFVRMAPLEQKALELCTGRVLDVGSGAGTHALFLQDERNLPVTAIDTSPGAVEVSKIRGLKDVRNIDYFDLENEQFDTILMLMNGSGIIGKLANLDRFFSLAGKLLSPEGMILMDSSDLQYLFEKEEDGGIWINPEEGYYGELRYQVSYKGETSGFFNWLYIDFDSLSLAATKNNFKCRLVKKGSHYDYLAELKPVKQ